MRAKVAKRLRRLVYGKGHHPGPVQHYVAPVIPAKKTKSNKTINGGFCIADRTRRQYQALKRVYLLGIFSV